MYRSRFPLVRLAWAIALLVLVPSCGGTHVSVYLVENEDVPREAAKGGEPVLSLFKAKFRECTYCETVEVKLAAGDKLAIRAEPKARVRLSPKDIEQIRLAEVRSVLDSKTTRWVALAVPSRQARDRLQKLSEEFPFDTVLVKVNGEATDLHNIATWSSGIRLSVFENKDDLERFAYDLGAPVAWVLFDEEEFEEDRRQLRQLIEGE